MGFLDLFRRSRAGEPYQGVVLRCKEPKIVKWPGWYGVDKIGEVDPKCQVAFNTDTRRWERVR